MRENIQDPYHPSLVQRYSRMYRSFVLLESWANR